MISVLFVGGLFVFSLQPQLLIQEKETQEGYSQESSDLNSNSPPATGGLGLDKQNYTRLKYTAILAVNHVYIPASITPYARTLLDLRN